MLDSRTELGTSLTGDRIARFGSDLRMRLAHASRAHCAWWRSVLHRSKPVPKPVPNQLESVHSQDATLPVAMDHARVRKCQPLAHYDDETHAKFLVYRIYEEAIAPAEILVADLKEIYADLLIEFQWAERPWIMVSREVRTLLGGQKTYAWVRTARGNARRMRVYRFPPSSPVMAPMAHPLRIAECTNVF